MSTEEQDRVIQQKGESVRIYGRAWWLDGAAETHDGRVAVARIHATSTDRRYPSAAEKAADPNLNPYFSCAKHTGELVGMILNLTDEDLVELGITPGKLKFPEVLDAPRPASNITSKPVSLRRQQQNMDWLQNDCIGKPANY